MAKYIVNIILVTACLFTYTSCIRKMNLYDENRNTGQDNNEKDTDSTPVYMYPFDKRNSKRYSRNHYPHKNTNRIVM